MVRHTAPGKTWRDAAGEFAVNVSTKMDGRYGTALDLLALKAGPHLWHLSVQGNPVWVPHGPGHPRSLSLAYLSFRLIEACEKAQNKSRERSSPMRSNRLPAKTRRKLVKDIRSVASFLEKGRAEIAMATVIARKYLEPAPGSYKPCPPGLTPFESQAWVNSEKRLTSPTLGRVLALIADQLDGKDYRTKPLGRREGAETALAAELVTWLRVATGALWNHMPGPIPMGGRPFYDVVAAFLQAAGWCRMTAPIIKSRLEARNGA